MCTSHSPHNVRSTRNNIHRNFLSKTRSPICSFKLCVGAPAVRHGADGSGEVTKDARHARSQERVDREERVRVLEGGDALQPGPVGTARPRGGLLERLKRAPRTICLAEAARGAVKWGKG